MDVTDGVVTSKSCQIFDKNSNLKKETLDKVLKLIKDSEKEPLQPFVHAVKQVPSIEYFANYPERASGGPATTVLRPRRVLLLSDSSQGQRRAGEASDELRKLIDSICKDLD